VCEVARTTSANFERLFRLPPLAQALEKT